MSDVIAVEGVGVAPPESGVNQIKTVDNRLYFYTGINADNALEFQMQLKALDLQCQWEANRLDVDSLPLYIHIHSYGGSVLSGFAMYDAIIACKSPVYTVVEGAVCSAGTFLSVAGDKRYIRPNAYLMVHQLWSAFWGTYEEFKTEQAFLDMLMDRLYGIYTKHSALKKKQIVKMLKKDTWLDSNKAIEYGFVDEVLK